MSDPSLRVQLAICASTPSVTCALRLGDGDAEALFREGTQLARGANLTALLAESFATRGIAPRALDEVLLDVGPGSYTGLRVAVTFARVAARFAGARIRVATSFELIAAAWIAASATPAAIRVDSGVGEIPPVRNVRIALDARRGRVHVGEIERGGESLAEIRLAREPAAVPVEQFVQSIAAGQTILVEGSLEGLLAAAIAEVGARHRAVPAYDAMQLFAPGLTLRETAHAALEPLYLMGSYAE